ncbi:MAG: M23 family metallopeptidase [Patescibacteria group bacterium]
MFSLKVLRFQPRTPQWLKDFSEFGRFLSGYIRRRGYHWFGRFENLKDSLVDILYRKRGRYVRPFLHLGTIGLIFLVILVGPVIFSLEEDEQTAEQSGGVLASAAYGSSFYTQQAEAVRQFRGGEIITHSVTDGETLSDIAERYGLEVTTILWENDITESTTLRPGMELGILPVDGVRHQVARGETIYTVARRYGLDESQAQLIVDYPFNEFLNDETFELAAGQYLMVPDGQPPQQRAVAQQPVRRAAILTPDAGSVTATGSFVWPAAGQISQGYRFYHRAIDISNLAGGPILAADGGVVIGSGWLDSSGYGNRVLIDHGNGYITLYAHLSTVQVVDGQRVNRGDVVGQMGTTGRSTGVHLHFEIRQGGVLHNPLDFLN